MAAARRICFHLPAAGRRYEPLRISRSSDEGSYPGCGASFYVARRAKVPLLAHPSVPAPTVEHTLNCVRLERYALLRSRWSAVVHGLPTTSTSRLQLQTRWLEFTPEASRKHLGYVYAYERAIAI